MGNNTIADIITSIRNTDMDRKGIVRIASTNITENLIKILLREGFIENVRKHREGNFFSFFKMKKRRSTLKKLIVPMEPSLFPEIEFFRRLYVDNYLNIII